MGFEVLEARMMLASTLFFSGDGAGGNDRLIAVDSLTRVAGTVNLDTQSGYTNVDTGETGLNVGVIDTGVVSGTPVVAIGGDFVRSYDAYNIQLPLGSPWDPDGVPNSAPGVDAIAIGDFGTELDRIVVSRETTPGANNVLVLATDAVNPGANVTVAGQPTGGGTAHGLVLADFQSATVGNEALFGLANPTVVGGNGHQLFYNTAGNSGQFFLNRLISDVAAGDLNGNGAIDYVLTGLNNMGAAGFGQGSQVYEANGGSGALLSSPGIGGPHDPPSFNAIAIGNLDLDGDKELVLVGDFVRVLDNNGAGNLTALPPLMESSALGGGAQFVDVVIADVDGDSVNEIIAVTDSGVVSMFGHAVQGNVGSPLLATAIGTFDSGLSALLGVASLEPLPDPAHVEHRAVFYNDSKFDGNDPAAGPQDDFATAYDKQPLLPSETSEFVNYTSYVQGINGILVDIHPLHDPSKLGLADFEFRVGNVGDPFPWNLAPQPVNEIAADVRLGAGVNGSDRITLIWNPGSIQKEWLEVRVKSTSNTGLILDDVFYVGNAIGDTGDSPNDAMVTEADVSGALANTHGPFHPAPITDIYDFNRDGLVGAADVLIARDHVTSPLTDLDMLTAPLPTVAPFHVRESDRHWLRLEESGGTGWNFDHVSNPGLGIDSAMSIHIDGSPTDFYLADVAGGMRLYLWDDGRSVPNLPHTGIKPTVGISGDILVGDIYAIERNPMTHFMRQEANLSASSTTTLFAAQEITQDANGGAGIVMHPDHRQDPVVWPGDPVDHPYSGALQLIAYGQGSGDQANAIVFKTRDGVNSVADRMVVKDDQVTVDGNVVATGTITPGSSLQYKQDIAALTYPSAVELLSALEPICFAYTADPTQSRLGFIAEDVPVPFGTARRQGVDPMGIVTVLTVVLQEQRQQIDELTDSLQAIFTKVGNVHADVPPRGALRNRAVTAAAIGTDVPGELSHGISTEVVSDVAVGVTTQHVAGHRSYSGESVGSQGYRTNVGDSTVNDLPTVSVSSFQQNYQVGNAVGQPANASVTNLAESLAASELIQAAQQNSVQALPASSLPSVSPFQVEEVGNEWIELRSAGGTSWNVDHVVDPKLGIDSALSIRVDSSPLDFYLTEDVNGTQLFLWNDGRPMPNMPLTGHPPDVAVWGDLLMGDIAGVGREPISHFLRYETNLSASSGTVLFSANRGINHYGDGGAGIVLRPDHYQDLVVWRRDPVDHLESGALLLNAFGRGNGAYANAIVLRSRDGPNSLVDRMLIKDGTVTVYGDIEATGSITPGSSREFKDEIGEVNHLGASELVHALDAVSFVYKNDLDQPRLGFIAEDVPLHFGTANRKGVDTMGITAALTSVVQQQAMEIETLAARIGRLEEAHAELGGMPVSQSGELAQSATINIHAGSGFKTMSRNVFASGFSQEPATSALRLKDFKTASSAASDPPDPTATTAEIALLTGNDTHSNPTITGINTQPSLTTAEFSLDVPAALMSADTVDAVDAFRVMETADRWMRLVEQGGTGWNFDHWSDPARGIDSAMRIDVDASPRDFYLADEPGGTRMYVWDDGLEVPELPHTNAKPAFALSGDMLIGDLITLERDAMSMFIREASNLSAAATTTINSSRNGFNNDVDGGSAIVLHPDHLQDQATFPGDPADHSQSGALELIAYGQGLGTYADTIALRTRIGINGLADRMLIRDDAVTVIGDLVATGTITAGSSSYWKQEIELLDEVKASSLLTSLNPVNFVYTANASQPRMGFIAEDVPEPFTTMDRKAVDTMGIIATLTSVVQQQQQHVQQLKELANQFLVGDKLLTRDQAEVSFHTSTVIVQVLDELVSVQDFKQRLELQQLEAPVPSARPDVRWQATDLSAVDVLNGASMGATRQLRHRDLSVLDELFERLLESSEEDSFGLSRWNFDIGIE